MVDKSDTPLGRRDVASGMTRQRFLLKSAGGVVGLTGMSAFLAACGDGRTAGTAGTATGAAGKPPSTPTGAVSLALAGAPPSLDPTTSFSANDLPVTGNIYEALLSYDGELRPSLATGFTSNPDATVWRFDLRPDVRFHDGAAFDANAVKASIEYTGRADSAVAFLVGAPKSIDASDPTTVVVTFAEPFPEFGRYMSIVKMLSPRLLDGPRAVVAKRVNGSPSGTGPFRYVRRQGNDIVAEAFDGYWGDGPYIADVSFRVVPDESTRVSALQAGDLDIVTKVPPPTAAGLEGQPSLQLLSEPTLAVMQLSLATSRPPFDDVRVRQALMYAIDRRGILDSVYRGKGIITGSPLPPDAYGFVRPQTQYAYDPGRAKSLLREAGHSGPVAFSMVVFNGHLLGSQLGQAIAEQADKAGFAVDFEVVDQGVGDKDIGSEDRKFDVYILENGFVAGSALHVNNVVFYSHYDGRALLGAIEKMNSIGDGPEREQILAEVQELWARELPCLPMWANEFIDALDSSISGFTPPLDGFQPLLGQAYRTAA